MAFSQHQQRRNAVRFELQDELQMDRLDFSRKVLQEELGFNPQQMDYIFALPGKKVFEVIFATLDFFDHCLERFRRKKDNPRLQKIKMVPLSERESKTVTVLMYSENVTNEDINTWMRLKCEVQRYIEVVDRDGIKTGERRFFIKLRRDLASGELLHLPSTIQLGRVRGNCFYPGQPKTCRKCGSLSHLAAECSRSYCRNCNSDNHTTRDCDQPLRCNLCGASNHTFSTCPKSYANIARQRETAHGMDTEDVPEADPEQHQAQQEGAASNNQQATPAQDVLGNQPAPSNDGQQAAPAQDVQRNQPAPNDEPPTPAPEDATVTPVESGQPEDFLAGERTVLDWSNPPDTLERDSDSESDNTADDCDRASDVVDLSNETQLDLPVRLANSTAICASDCRDRMDSLFAVLTSSPGASADIIQPTPDVDNHQMSTSQNRQQHDSAEESIGTQVISNLFSTSVPFLDDKKVNAFSSATLMKVAEGRDVGPRKRHKKRRRKDGDHSPATTSLVSDPQAAGPPPNA